MARAGVGAKAAADAVLRIEKFDLLTINWPRVPRVPDGDRL